MLLMLLIHTLAVKMSMFFFTHEVKICNKNIHVTNYEIVITILQLHIVSNINNVITVITVLNYAFSRARKVRFSFMQ